MHHHVSYRSSLKVYFLLFFSEWKASPCRNGGLLGGLDSTLTACNRDPVVPGAYPSCRHIIDVAAVIPHRQIVETFQKLILLGCLNDDGGAEPQKLEP